MIDLKTFFNSVRGGVFRGRLSQSQVNGMKALIKVWNRSYARMAPSPDVSRKWLAYCLATAYHETAHKMEPVRETLARTDRQAINRLENAYRRGRLRVSKPYWRDGWFGRGYVQLTHKFNYDRASREIGIDFTANPSLALDPEHSAEILFKGSIEGWFTRKKLGDYLSARKTDFRGARRIINGMDKAGLIAGYASEFYDALTAAETDVAALASDDTLMASVIAEDAKVAAPTTENKHSTQKMGILGSGLVLASSYASELYNNLSFISFSGVIKFMEERPLFTVAVLLVLAYLAYNWSERSRFQKEEGV
jgi:putative chitinase